MKDVDLTRVAVTPEIVEQANRFKHRIVNAMEAEMATIQSEVGDMAFSIEPLAMAVAHLAGSLVKPIPEEDRIMIVIQLMRTMLEATGMNFKEHDMMGGAGPPAYDA